MSDTAVTLLDDYRTGQRCPWAPVGSKRRWLARSASSVTTVLVHATAVKGGFSAGVRGLSEALAEMEPDPDKPVSDVMTEARIRALVKRFRETPYHGYFISKREGAAGGDPFRVSVVQWPATDLTYHGNAPNRMSIGWAYDGKFTPAESDDLDVEGARASLTHLIERALEQGCPLSRVTPHANHAPPPRQAKPHDPGPRVWLDVVCPVAEKFGLDLALDWTTGGAAPWAKRWMEAAA